MDRKPLQGFIDQRADGTFIVGTRDETSRKSYAPLEVHADDTWLYLTTDPYEGASMVGIEALPFLIEALQKLQGSRR